MGSNTKPIMTLTKEERKNPFHKATKVNENMLNKKGLLQLMSMGVINKQTNIYDLLNLRYEVEDKPEEQYSEPQSQAFLTNPTILINTYY